MASELTNVVTFPLNDTLQRANVLDQLLIHIDDYEHEPILSRYWNTIKLSVMDNKIREIVNTFGQRNKTGIVEDCLERIIYICLL